jgi:hypothetical protein
MIPNRFPLTFGCGLLSQIHKGLQQKLGISQNWAKLVAEKSGI